LRISEFSMNFVEIFESRFGGCGVLAAVEERNRYQPVSQIQNAGPPVT